jgi:hypothetical protein
MGKLKMILMMLLAARQVAVLPAISMLRPQPAVKRFKAW